MINCWLKTRNRGNLDFVLKSLNFWLAAFSDKSRYKIYIYSEDIDLPREYHSFQIIRPHNLAQDSQVQKIHKLIRESGNISDFWIPAAKALSAPYFYLKEDDKLLYNIDADDILIFGPIKKYLYELERTFEDQKIFTLSHDIHYSKHIGDFCSFRPHHFTLGVNLSRPEKMRELIIKGLMNKSIPRPPWQSNIDWLLDYQLDSIDTPYISWVTPSEFQHYWPMNNNHDELCKSIKYNIQTDKIEGRLAHIKEITNKHPRTLLIK